MEEQLRKILVKGVVNHIFPGAGVGFIKDDQVGRVFCGRLTYSEESPEVDNNTVYDIASLTKSIPTSSLALQLVDEKLLSLEDPVQKVLPNFIHPEVMIKHLLTQTVALCTADTPLQLSTLKDKTPEEILQSIYSAQLSVPSGTSYAYNNATSIILGNVVERVMGMSLDKAGEKKFFQPLGMHHTTFHPQRSSQDIAPTEIDAWRYGTVLGVVHDESAYTLGQKMVVGSAGVFSTVNDLLLFLSMLMQEGQFQNRQYFSGRIIKEMYTNQLEAMGSSSGLGWELNQPQFMGKYSHKQMIGKTGFTGCMVSLDVPRKRGMVLLSNCQYPQRKENSTLINSIRREIADVIFE